MINGEEKNFYISYKIWSLHNLLYLSGTKVEYLVFGAFGTVTNKTIVCHSTVYLSHKILMIDKRETTNLIKVI